MWPKQRRQSATGLKDPSFRAVVDKRGNSGTATTASTRAKRMSSVFELITLSDLIQRRTLLLILVPLAGHNQQKGDGLFRST
jgi:hypothetical protein